MSKMRFLNLIWVIVLIALVAYVAWFVYNSQKNKPATTEKTANEPANTVVSEKNINVSSPKDGDTIGSPVTVSGEVRVFENQFVIRIKDGNGKILIEESAMGENGDAGVLNPFTKDIAYPKPTTPTGSIEVFDYSAKDGSEIDKVVVPIKFK